MVISNSLLILEVSVYVDFISLFYLFKMTSISTYKANSFKATYLQLAQESQQSDGTALSMKPFDPTST